MGILSFIWLVPFLTGLALIAFVPNTKTTLIKWASLGAVTVSLLAMGVLCLRFDYNNSGALQFQELFPLVKDLNIHYHMGVDGISLIMGVLTSVIMFTGVLISWGVTSRSKEFFALLLMLGGAVFGVFFSFDIFVLFVFYEATVIPMYLLIGIWGSGSKEYSAMKLALMLMGGSAFMLVGILAIYFATPTHTFDLFEIAHAAKNFSPEFQRLWFPILFLGFGVLAALWPLHTWCPDGHSAAPTALSMMAAGVKMKLGAYGCLRIAIFLLPQGAAYWSHALAVLCLVNIVYGSIGAAAQTDFKFVTAYSSVSHMGLVLLGLATLGAMGTDGAVLQMFAHGIVTATFFALIGMTYGRTHTRILAKLGGLIKVLPFLGVCYIIAAMSGLGMPGLISFPAELLVMQGAFYKSDPFMKVVAVIAITSIIFTAIYVLRIIQKTFFGPMTDPHYETLTDATLVEKIPLLLLLVIIIGVGIYPYPVLKTIDGSVVIIMKQLAGTF